MAEELADLDLNASRTGASAAGAVCLIRHDGVPLGRVTIFSPSGEITAGQLRKRITAELDPDAGTVASSAPAGDAPSISVIVPTRERPGSAVAAVGSVLASPYPSNRLEVLVVDNAPRSDAARREIAAAFADEARVQVLTERRPGGSNARNRGIAAASGSILAFIDDDVTVDEGWAAGIARGFTRGARVGAVTGAVFPRALEAPAQIWLESYYGFGSTFGPRLYDLDENRPAGDPLFPFRGGRLGTGGNMAFAAAALAELGAFDRALGTATPTLSGEDRELLMRVLLGGYQVAIEPAALVYHDHPVSYEQLRRRIYGYGVGLTASLTRTILDRPRLIPALLRRLPRGIGQALRPDSAAMLARTGFPRELSRLELRGLAAGPWAYLRSRRALRMRDGR